MCGVGCSFVSGCRELCGECGKKELKNRNVWAVFDFILCEVGSWTMVNKEFKGCYLNDFVRDWITCILSSTGMQRARSGFPRPLESLKSILMGSLLGTQVRLLMGVFFAIVWETSLWPKEVRLGDAMLSMLSLFGLLEAWQILKTKGIQEGIVEGDSGRVFSWERGGELWVLEVAALHL